MYRYVIKRLLMLIPITIITSFLVFFIINLAPGDVVGQLTGSEATLEEVAALRAELDLDKPIVVRYAKYFAGLLRGDLGTSYITGKSVYDSYMEKLPATLKLAVASILVSIAISIPLGISSAVHRGSVRDNVGMVAALLGLSMPNFWLGLLLIIVFALHLGWLRWNCLHYPPRRHGGHRPDRHAHPHHPLLYAGCHPPGLPPYRPCKGGAGAAGHPQARP